MKSIKTYTNARDALKEIWGYDEFRGVQGEIIDQVAAGKDGLAVLGTGFGKSLCYQIPALMKDGTTIVVTPLISLMIDQVDALKSKGVPATLLYGEQPISEREEAAKLVESKKAKLLYVSPEKLQDEDFQQWLTHQNISMFAIDEAHCVSIWGRDFRDSYTHVGKIMDKVGEAKGERFQRIGLTATANSETQEDILGLLRMKEDAFKFVGSFDRENLHFEVRQTGSKLDSILDYIVQVPNEPLIVYSSTIKQAEKLVQYLDTKQVPAGLYHGKMPAEVKNDVQEKFMKDEINVIVATNAFGMGVDKANVRHVLHMHMPPNIENFYQEAGRLGRNGEEGKSVIFYDPKDRGLQEFFINASFPDAKNVMEVLNVLASFDPTESFNVTYGMIANMAKANLKEMEVGGALRILNNLELITLKEDLGTKTANIEINDLTVPIDLSFIGKRKTRMANRVNQMVRYCETKACRTSFVTTALGDPRKHGNCGRCDNCKNDLKLERGHQKKIADEVLDNTISLVKDLSEMGIPQRSVVENMLLGIRNIAIKTRRWDDLPQFGALKSWSKDDVKTLLDNCIQNELVYVSPKTKKIELDKNGEKWLNGEKMQIIAPEALRHKGVGKDNQEKRVEKTGSKSPIVTKKDVIESWRKEMALEMGVPEIMIINDAQVDAIARENHVKSREKLLSLGITPNRVNKIGDSLLERLAVYYAAKPPEFNM